LRLVALLAALAACSHGDPAPKPLPWAPNHGWLVDANDLVTAVADDWTSTQVTLARWHRANLDGDWMRVGEPWPGVIGRSGLAWGDGLHGTGAPAGHDGPVKREGDGRSPAGAFRITHGFGYAPYKTDRYRPVERTFVLPLDFIPLTDATECVDDPRSAAYNTIVERTGSADWTSAEHMRRDDDLYSVGAVVDHNPDRTPGEGSCIFLHVWSGPDSTTVGCTAMDKDRLVTLVGSLGQHVVFVQLPRAEYRALQHEWGLPPQ
jgi:D-alanyl-D-alanine dipeptidase